MWGFRKRSLTVGCSSTAFAELKYQANATAKIAVLGPDPLQHALLHNQLLPFYLHRNIRTLQIICTDYSHTMKEFVISQLIPFFIG